MDEGKFLERAVQLAEESVRDGGGPFGAVVVRHGVILGEGRNRVVGNHDPTAHAEVMAIRAACKSVGNHDLSGAIVYASCEPCPMCHGAALWARVDRVVYAANQADAARAGFDDQAFHEELDQAPETRRMPLIQVRVEGAERPFDLWQEAGGERY